MASPHGIAALRLNPSDEHCHAIEPDASFNESMYANVLDASSGLGVWVRVGNRPNEGYAEVTACVYLPDGRVAFMFGRPESHTNDTLAAGGATFEVIEPFERIRMTYEGPLCVLTDPREMADPRSAFTSNPIVEGSIDLELVGLTLPFGGEPVDPSESGVLTGFARGHYEQHIRGTGTVVVDGEGYALDALGLRDHSWGPRYWQNLTWYRFLPISFTPDFGLCAVVIGDDEGGVHPGGMVMRRDDAGDLGYAAITDVAITSTYDDEGYAVAQTLEVTTDERSYTLRGESLAMIPLRNRRGGKVTRITEAMTRFTCDELPEIGAGVGMSEYLDQMVDERPVGWPA